MKEKQNMEFILQKLPKNPSSLDFATMEKKIEVMERNNRENEIELRNAFKRAFNFDPFNMTNTDINQIKSSYEKEINVLKNTIGEKNQ